MIFNGIDLSSHFRIKNIVGRNYADYQWNLIDVPGMDGVHLGGGRRPPRYIDVYTAIYGKDRAEIRKKIDMLNGIFAVESPVPIIFPDEPDRTYFGVIEMTDDQGDRFFRSDGSFTILCPDPYKYGPELEATFPSDAVTVTNNGTAPAKPIYEMEVNEPTTFAAISNGEETMMIGRQATVEEQEVEPMTTILRDTMQNTVGWTTGVNVDSNRIVTGEMDSNGEYFYAKSFGTGLEGQYHGPALRTSLSETLQDFRAESLVRFSNGIGEVGRLEFQVLDASNNLVARFGLYDNSPSRPITRFSARAGDSAQGQQITDTEATYWQNWTNFFGLIRIERRGNQWQAYATLIDPITWRYHTSHLSPILTTNYGNAEIAQIQIHMTTYTASWGTYEPVYMRVEDLWVRRINDVEGVPIIANPGDLIVFDMNEKLILINGEPRKDLKQFGAEYFPLKPGVNHLVAMPENAFTTKVRFREPYR